MLYFILGRNIISNIIDGDLEISRWRSRPVASFKSRRERLSIG